MNRHLFSEINRKLKERSGYLLMNIVLLLLVLVVIVSSLTFNALANHKGANLSSNHNSIYYFAEGGLNEFGDLFYDYVGAMEPIQLKEFTELSTEAIAEKLEQDIAQWISNETELMNQEASRSININVIDEEVIEILSTATLGGVTRTVSQYMSNFRSFNSIETSGGMCVSHAMMAKDKIELLGGGSVKGSLKITHPVTGSLVVKDQGPIPIDNTVVFGKFRDSNKIHEVLAPKGISWERFLGYIKEDPKYIIEDINEEFPEVVMPEIPSKSVTTVLQKKDFINGTDLYNDGKLEIKFEASSSVEKFYSNSTLNLKALDSSVKNVSLHSFVQVGTNWSNENSEFIIDVGDRDFNLVLDHMVLTSSIKVIGTGNLRIFVKDTPNMKSKFEPLRVYHAFDKGYSKEKIAIIFYNNSATAKNIHLDSSKKFFAFSLIAENHNLEISPGPKYTLHVMLLGENNKFTTPNSHVGIFENKWDLVFVPKGHISYNSNTFTGAMIAKTIAFENQGANITFKNEVDGLLPDEFDIFNPTNCSISGGSGDGNGGSQGELILGPIREVKP